MRLRIALRAILGLALLSAAGFGIWIASLPPASADLTPPQVPQAETDALLAALEPPKRARPLVAIIGINDATETTDYLLPYGILKRADVAEVVSLATAPGPVRLFPALTVQPDATIAAFDAAHPQGADYVIVPAMSRDNDPAVIAWLRSQAGKGAVIIGICAGAKVVAAAGLLNGKRAVTHWYYLDEMRKIDPTISHVPDRRMVADGGVVTTTGITASMPMMLTLVEAIAGRARAEAVARELGIARWDARHASGAFALTRPFAATVLANRLAFWNHEELGIALAPGMDEISLALAADAWSRTYRSKVTTYAASGMVGTRSGIRLIPDRQDADWPRDRRVPTFSDGKPADVLDRTLDAITARYGASTADAVAMQLEYPR
ncbi:transcriptional regulator [Paracoccus versutus]|uniref:DJ-1/PfpI family protein n=1 Tax=Paracoccus versutus TaxID=34007 RepID=A0AAQ0HEH5_PARVE|nr:DJ-1/PfpI family protein [Paracoccus versutus]KGJ07699.1 transcriptional regulator [Paracoccus versutus]REG32707.1 DJ-1/PfpI family protein [Paracoccus versutus]WEJ77581.1 transcriptional regulator [Paracoccus versutus]